MEGLFNLLKSRLFNSSIGPIVKNISWLFSYRIFELLVSLLVGIWLVRYLGPTEFGLFSYVLAIGAIITPFIGLGVSGILTREILVKPKLKNSLLGTAFWINIFSGVAGFILLNLVALILKPGDFESLLLVFIYSFSLVIPSFGVVGNWFESRLESKILVKGSIWALVISNIFKVAAILLQLPLIYFILTSLVDTIIRIVVVVYYYLRSGERIQAWKFNYGLAVKLIKNSWPLIFSGLMIIIYMKIDQVMISVMMTNYQLGLYSIAVKLTEIFYFLPGAIMSSLFPALISSKKLGKNVYFSRLVLLFSFMTYTPFLIIIPIFLIAPYFVLILYGAEYSGAILALAVSIWALWGVFVKTAVDSYLICENKTKIVFVGALIGAVANIALNLIFIPLYGIVGAALATVISYVLAAYLSVLLFKETRSLFFVLLRAFNPFTFLSMVKQLLNKAFKQK